MQACRKDTFMQACRKDTVSRLEGYLLGPLQV